MLHFANGEIFASGAAAYDFLPPSPEDINARILLRIAVEEIPVVAALDTGAPFLILNPVVTERLDIDATAAVGQTSITMRRGRVVGKLFRVNVDLEAAEGEGQRFEATAFLPDPGQEEFYGNQPIFLGMENCMDRVRFAIDPGKSTFYFGPLP